MSNVPLPQRLIRAVLRPLSSLASRHQNRVVIALAMLVAAGAVYAILSGHTRGMKDRAYDVIMKARLISPAADPGIVIVDIDEASLAVMAREYGRWPWPRTVIGELVEGIARQKPKAIVFDVMFSDPDVYNKDADKYFRDVVRRNPNSYFPLIRLDPENDARSSLRLSALPGTVRGEEAEDAATLAAVVPFVLDQLDGRRLGTTNLYTDEDGIVRRYQVWLEAHGWWIGSLPANVVRGTGGTVPEQEDVLLNWRGKPPSYRRAPLHEVYADLQSSAPKRPADEFAGKIVIIGSTAPSLYDYKPTPVAKIHPGVELLATAIDNLQRGDWLRELPRWITVLVTVLAIAVFALAAVYNVDVRRQNLFFTLAQVAFVAVAYLLLNFSTVYLDMTAPIAFSLAYFSLVKLIGVVVTFRRNGHPLFSTLLDEGRSCRAVVMQVRVLAHGLQARLALTGRLKKAVGQSRRGVVTPPLFVGLPLMYAFFRDRLLFYWLLPVEEERDAVVDVAQTLERFQRVIDKRARRLGEGHGPLATVALHSFTFTVDADDRWRQTGEEGVARLMAMDASRAGDGAMALLASEDMKTLCLSVGNLDAEVLERACR
jgi:CHASE2 domain-containing sensor protein